MRAAEWRRRPLGSPREWGHTCLSTPPPPHPQVTSPQNTPGTPKPSAFPEREHICDSAPASFGTPLPSPELRPRPSPSRSVSYYLRLSSRVSSSDEKVPLLMLWGEWLFFPADASRENGVSFFFLLPNNFLKGWNLPPFFLSVDCKTNTCCSSTGLLLGAQEQITAELPLAQGAGAKGNHQRERAAEPCARNARACPVRAQSGGHEPRAQHVFCLPAPQKHLETARRGSTCHGGRRSTPLAHAGQRRCLLSLTKQMAHALFHGRKTCKPDSCLRKLTYVYNVFCESLCFSF